MGNYASCSFVSSRMKSSKAARVIFPGGEIRQFREPVKAAELMLECPHFYMVNSRSLNVGRRFSPLSADEDLEFGNVYIMFPMKRVNSIVTAADMAVLLLAASSAAKRISAGQVGVLPQATTMAQAKNAQTIDDWQGNEVRRSRLNLEEGESFPAQEFRYRSTLCRSRKPMLDTITEEPICSR